MQMKVNRVVLIAKIRAAQKAEDMRVVKGHRTYIDAQAKAHDTHIANVRAYLKKLDGGAPAVTGGYELVKMFDRGVTWPAEPHKRRDFSCLIEKLELSVDEVLTIPSNSEYLQFINCTCD